MADPFVAEIRIFAFNFAPKGWAFCNGQLIPISQNTALFALLGTTYGGDGRSTFALPDLQGRAAMQPGQGQGLTPRLLGEMDGSAAVTLIQNEIPAHAHSVSASTQPGEDASPQGEVLARSVGASLYQTTTNQNVVAMAPAALASTGGNQPHNNMQPFLTLHFCIALIGVFPSRW